MSARKGGGRIARVTRVACLALALFIAMLVAPAMAADPTVSRIPLRPGLRLVSVLHFPAGDRENIVTVERVTADAVTYSWHAVNMNAGKREEADFSRSVLTTDLASATRLHTVFRSRDQADYPGYTAFTISKAVYESLRTTGSAAFTIAQLDDASGSSGVLGAMASAAKFKGTLTRVGAGSESFPLIVNGQRLTVPALHTRGSFAYQDHRLEQELWVLADSEHPLLLRTVSGNDVLQMVRIETSADVAGAVIEQSLEKECRAELPGIYFAFGTADLDRASNQTLADVAAILGRHPQWTLSIEGHTDNIGTDASNQTLSEARARAVQTSLATQHGVSASRLKADGFGASKPRETNDTLEGRARNRRVELVRSCSERH